MRKLFSLVCAVGIAAGAIAGTLELTWQHPALSLVTNGVDPDGKPISFPAPAPVVFVFLSSTTPTLSNSWTFCGSATNTNRITFTIDTSTNRYFIGCITNAATGFRSFFSPTGAVVLADSPVNALAANRR